MEPAGGLVDLLINHRQTRFIDAAFSHRIVLPDDLEVTYRDPDGKARLLYFDRQYHDTFALLHKDARDDSVPLTLKGIDNKVLDVRLLSALDLAVSKIGRFSSQDREDITALARQNLIRSAPLRKRAEDAVLAYVGNVGTVRTSIDLACRTVEDAEKLAPRAKK